jgi:hypothetical protein
MSIEGFKLAEKGPAAGLLWVNFSNIVVHGKPGTPEYAKAMESKARLVLKVLATEFKLGTRHFSFDLKPLKTIQEALRSYEKERGFYVELRGNPRKKMEALDSAYGIDRLDLAGGPPPKPGLEGLPGGA